MSRVTKVSLLFLLAALVFTSCRKKEFDEYYARPDGLADPIYKVLESKKNFTILLACIDKAGYKEILGEAGYWTFFAPTDDAFKKYFQDNNISGVDKLADSTARKIVTYCLVYNSYRKEQLTNMQTSLGVVPDVAFKRKTAYYDFVYTENGKKMVANNRNGSAYVVNDNNNKNLPYFIDKFLTANGLTSTDYKSFYPNATYTGFSVADANVTEADIPAENGTIHVIDKVIAPLPSIEQYMASNSQYSEFRKLLNKLAVYIPNTELTRRYNVLTGKTDSVYLKSYSALLAFSPNNENYIGATATEAQATGWSITVPTNTQLLAYTKKLLQYYGGSFDAAPPQVLIDFLNAHMFRNAVWPARITTEGNFQGEAATYAQANILEKKVLSNGFFYGTNQVQDANVFRTVYGFPYLDPKYSLMIRAIDATDLRTAMKVPTVKYTVFMMSNTDLIANRYNFYPDRSNSWGYQATVGGTIDYTSTASDRVYRITQSSVVYTPKGEFDDLSGDGVAEAFNGEYIRFKAGKVYASGNVAAGTSVTIDSSKNAYNGKVYYTKGLLTFAENTFTLGTSIELLGNVATSNANYPYFNFYYRYLVNSSLWVAATKDILGVSSGSFYTVNIPTNAAIMAAVKKGLLPGNILTGDPNFTPTAAADKDKVTNFINYSILNKFAVAADGKKDGLFPTLLKDVNGNTRYVTVYYPAGNVPSQMQIWDGQRKANDPATTATINISFSNNLGNRALIHSLNKILDYN
ncbi:fasciclin domain-containing protein [Hufsiella ginkgonis]|uniref:FAS1 domain-containing protein n=1 Tax=Hufsiella ginkgonis TaxID=2695274 RepID=A0A7K1Y240_9SPHI|nr:fasciclin domain-containing protein [Hufsiella ginkgonis]MXV17343.1 hypothetical protein [Hufsiella ginkgonis]